MSGRREADQGFARLTQPTRIPAEFQNCIINPSKIFTAPQVVNFQRTSTISVSSGIRSFLIPRTTHMRTDERYLLIGSNHPARRGDDLDFYQQDI
jgi:hypothetical protein